MLLRHIFFQYGYPLCRSLSALRAGQDGVSIGGFVRLMCDYGAFAGTLCLAGIARYARRITARYRDQSPASVSRVAKPSHECPRAVTGQDYLQPRLRRWIGGTGPLQTSLDHGRWTCGITRWPHVTRSHGTDAGASNDRHVGPTDFERLAERAISRRGFLCGSAACGATAFVLAAGGMAAGPARAAVAGLRVHARGRQRSRHGHRAGGLQLARGGALGRSALVGRRGVRSRDARHRREPGGGIRRQLRRHGAL